MALSTAMKCLGLKTNEPTAEEIAAISKEAVDTYDARMDRMRRVALEYKVSENPDVVALATKFCECRNSYVLTFNLQSDENLHNFESTIRNFSLINFSPLVYLHGNAFNGAHFSNGQFSIKYEQDKTERFLEMVYKNLLPMAEIDEENEFVKFARFFIREAQLRLGGYSVVIIRS